MSKKQDKDIRDILVETTDGKLLHLATLVSLFNKDGTLFSYKIVAPFKNLSRLEGAEVNTITGIQKMGRDGEQLLGGAEITYHPRGEVMLKDTFKSSNIVIEKHHAIDKLKSNTIFFQIAGLGMRILEPATRNMGHATEVIRLKAFGVYTINDYINIDVSIGSSKTYKSLEIPEHTEKLFPDPILYEMVSQKIPIVLCFFIYKFQGAKDRMYVSIPSRKPMSILKKHIRSLITQPILTIKDYLVDVGILTRKIQRKISEFIKKFTR